MEITNVRSLFVVGESPIPLVLCSLAWLSLMMQLTILVICSTGFLIIVSIFFWIMRSWKFKSESNLSSSDEEDSDAEELPVPENLYNRSLDTDAVNPDGGQLSANLTISDVRKIEEDLEDYEKVSLIFLLSDNYEDCLKNIDLSEWAKIEKLKSNTWEEKLWEAMAIIKNFQIPKMYGISKQHLIREYFPFQHFTTKYVSKFKKVLFFVCESLNKINEEKFLEQLQKDFEKKSLRFFEFPHMEMYFSYLLKISYISPNRTQNCLRIAKTLQMENIYDLFKFIEELKIDVRTPRLNRLYSNTGTSISADEDINNDSCISVANSDSTQDNVPIKKSVDGIYNMNGKKLCLIIDQEHFYSYVEPEFRHLQPGNINDEKLHTRLGTKEDSNRLKLVFEKRMFDVKTVYNRTHLQIIDVLKEFVASIDRSCSCFFVIILSHGNRDVVYGSNSCQVKISEIIDIMDSKNCRGVPKILLLQACQGLTLLENFDENLTTDGTTGIEGSDPKGPDFVLFSTIPGFASIRDKKKGTWFIQSFCNQVEDFAGTEHFMDICTKVSHDVKQKKWRQWHGTFEMLLYLRSTLTNKLYI